MKKEIKDNRKKKLSADYNIKDASGLVENLMVDLQKKGAVRLLHFGLFKVQTVKGKTRYDFVNKKIVPIPTFKKISFTPAKGLREMINKK